MKTTLIMIGWGVLAGMAAQAGETHVVARGETLWSIARSHGVTVAELRDQNGLEGDLIVAGRRLMIPGGGDDPPATHAVVRGENLFRIGQRYGIAVRSLQEWNGLKRPEDLRAGKVLRLKGLERRDEAATVGNTEKAVTNEAGPETGDELLKPLLLGKSMRFGDLATKHGMTVEQLNALNGWSFLKDDLLAGGTEVYVGS